MVHEILIQGQPVATIALPDSHPMAGRVASILPYITPAATVRRQRLTKLQFLRRFSVEERLAVRSAGGSDPIVADFLKMLDLAEEVIVTDSDTVAAIDYLVSQGLLTAERRSLILAP